MKKLFIYEILTIVGILILGAFICMNTCEINKLAKKNNDLEYRIKLIETKNSLYEYDFNQLYEYHNGELK